MARACGWEQGEVSIGFIVSIVSVRSWVRGLGQGTAGAGVGQRMEQERA